MNIICKGSDLTQFTVDPFDILGQNLLLAGADFEHFWPKYFGCIPNNKILHVHSDKNMFAPSKLFTHRQVVIQSWLICLADGAEVAFLGILSSTPRELHVSCARKQCMRV